MRLLFRDSLTLQIKVTVIRHNISSYSPKNREDISSSQWGPTAELGPGVLKIRGFISNNDKNVINDIETERLSWFGHLHRMPEDRMVKRVYKWKPMLTQPLGRPKNRWEDNITNDMKKLKIKNWTSCIQDRKKWKLITEKAKTFEEEEEEEEVLIMINEILKFM